MKGLIMPPFPRSCSCARCGDVVKRNLQLGFAPSYDPAWEKDNFVAGHSVYIRPFTYAEGGIGVNLCASPWVVIVTSDVGSYFRPGNSKAITTTRIRATPGGTGWIKADSNYVTSALAKKEAEAPGYMECMFLDAREHRYFEEGSSCNIFFVLKDGTLVTPRLEDTILPGITREPASSSWPGTGGEGRGAARLGGGGPLRGPRVLRLRHRRRGHPHRVPHPRGPGSGLQQPQGRRGDAGAAEDAEGHPVRRCSRTAAAG